MENCEENCISFIHSMSCNINNVVKPLTHSALDHIKMRSDLEFLIRFSKNSELCTKRKRKIFFTK